MGNSCLSGRQLKKKLSQRRKSSITTNRSSWDTENRTSKKRETFYTCEDLDSVFVPKPETQSPIIVKFVDEFYKSGAHKLGENYSHVNAYDLPFNEPASSNIFEFETEMFKGKCLLRFKNCPNEDTRYFKGRKRKQQWIFQGVFKDEIIVGDVMSGYELNKPGLKLPNKYLLKPVLAVIRKIAPPMKENVYGRKPYVYNPLLQTIQKLDISLPGTEPNITNREIVENNKYMFAKQKNMKPKSAKARKHYFSSISHNKLHKFEPGYVYTFEFFEDKVDISTFKFILPIVHINLMKHMGDEPIPIMAKIINPKSKYHGKYLFKFYIYHKDQLPEFSPQVKSSAKSELQLS